MEEIQVTQDSALTVEEITALLQSNSLVHEDGCWEWTGGRTGKGYAQFYLAGQYVSANKLALIASLGRAPEEGMRAFHTCFRRDCVNPDHSEERTPGEIRMLTHDRHREHTEAEKLELRLRAIEARLDKLED